jgi:hypothetical protein
MKIIRCPSAWLRGPTTSSVGSNCAPSHLSHHHARNHPSPADGRIVIITYQTYAMRRGVWGAQWPHNTQKESLIIVFIYSIVGPTIVTQRVSSAPDFTSNALLCWRPSAITIVRAVFDFDSLPALDTFGSRYASLFPTCDPACWCQWLTQPSSPIFLPSPPVPCSSGDGHEPEPIPGLELPQTLSASDRATARSPVIYPILLFYYSFLEALAEAVHVI